MSRNRAKLATAGALAMGALLVLVLVLTAGPSTPPNAAPQGGSGGQEDRTLVAVDTVISETFAETVPVIGRLVSRQSGVVAAQTAGAIKTVHAHVGDPVEEGQIIAELVPDQLNWTLKETQADLARAKAELGIKRGEVARLKRLRSSAAFQQSRYDDATLEVTDLEAAVAAQTAKVELARINAEYANIRAPFSGTITARHTDAGAYVAIGSAVVTMVDDKSLEAEADVPSKRIGALAPDTAVTIETNGLTFPAKVRAIVPEENPLTRTRAVRFELPITSGESQLTSNQSVTVRIPVAKGRPVVTVHKDAIINRPNGYVAFAITDGKAQLRELELGEPVGNRFEVLSGLSEGETVAVRGNERLRPGQPVRVEDGV